MFGVWYWSHYDQAYKLYLETIFLKALMYLILALTLGQLEESFSKLILMIVSRGTDRDLIAYTYNIE